MKIILNVYMKLRKIIQILLLQKPVKIILKVYMKLRKIIQILLLQKPVNSKATFQWA